MEGAREFGFRLNTRHSGISIKPIIRQQDKILKSFVEVAKNRNFKPDQVVELSSIKLFYLKLT